MQVAIKTPKTSKKEVKKEVKKELKKEVTNGSLMNLTKEQLVDIILRKDDVERELRTEIKQNIECISGLEDQLTIETDAKNEYKKGEKVGVIIIMVLTFTLIGCIIRMTI